MVIGSGAQKAPFPVFDNLLSIQQAFSDKSMDFIKFYDIIYTWGMCTVTVLHIQTFGRTLTLNWRSFQTTTIWGFTMERVYEAFVAWTEGFFSSLPWLQQTMEFVIHHNILFLFVLVMVFSLITLLATIVTTIDSLVMREKK
jgi:type IV secretory pathway VirB6-like protein